MSSKLYPKIDNAKEKLIEITKEKLELLYDGEITEKVEKRYETELKKILDNNYENIFMCYYLICKKIENDGEFFSLRGEGSNSLIAYLLGISKINPLENNLKDEMFLGINGEKEPDFIIEVRENYRNQVIKYIIESYGKEHVAWCGVIKDGSVVKHPGALFVLPKENKITDYTKVKYEEDIDCGLTCTDYNELDCLFKVNIMINKNLEYIKRLEKQTGKMIDKINIHDEKLLTVFPNNDCNEILKIELNGIEKILEKKQPENIEDLGKIIALLHGTEMWENNIESLIDNHNWDEICCSRDDIYELLLNKNVPNDIAVTISEFIGKGKINFKKEKWQEYKKILNEVNIPIWQIESFEKIKYMLPKSHCINIAKRILILAWYKLYFPKEFESVINY